MWMVSVHLRLLFKWLLGQGHKASSDALDQQSTYVSKEDPKMYLSINVCSRQGLLSKAILFLKFIDIFTTISLLQHRVHFWQHYTLTK